MDRNDNKIIKVIVLAILLLLTGCASGGDYSPEAAARRQNAAVLWSTAFGGLGQAYQNKAAVQQQNLYLMQQLQMQQSLEHIKNFGIPRSY